MSVGFHSKHGEGVEVEDDRRTARMMGDFLSNTTLFTERCIQSREIWTLRVEEGVIIDLFYVLL